MAAAERATALADDSKPDGEGILQRWSRRKAEAAADGETSVGPETASPGNTPPALETPADETGDDESDVDLASLPDIESLDVSSDFSVFMQKGIPDELQTRALQKLWRLDPAFGHIDGLLEYGDDFNALGTTSGVVKTLYKVGKGMVQDGDDEADDETPAESGLPTPDRADAADPDTPDDLAAETRETPGAKEQAAAEDGDAALPRDLDPQER